MRRFAILALSVTLFNTAAHAQNSISDRLQMLSSRINSDLPYKSQWGTVTGTRVEGNVLVFNATITPAFERTVGHNGVLEDFRKTTCENPEFRRIIEGYGVTFRMIATSKNMTYTSDANKQTCVGAFGSIFP